MRHQLLLKTFFYSSFFLFGASQIGRTQTTVIIQPDAATGQDSRIWSLEPSTPTGTVEDFIAAYWTWGGEPGILRSLVRFDLSFIPSTVNITSAKLSLYYNATSGSAGQAGSNASVIQRITSSWDENTVTWNTQPTVTTSGETNLAQSITSNQDYPDINVKSMVAYMVNHPSKNYGFMLRLQDENALFSSMKFCSSDCPDAQLHPKLVITYDTIPAVPDSTTCNSSQPDAASGIDARVWSLEPATPAPVVDDFIAAYWTWSGDEGILRSVIRFDLSSIPTTATVSSAKLSLYYNPTSGSAGQAGANASWLQRIISPWDENSVTWTTQPATTTEHQSLLAESTNPTQDYPNINVKKMVKYMVNHPNKNYGFMLRLQDETALYSSLKFASSDHSNASIHPKLKVCYTTSNGGKQITHEAEFDALKLNVYPNPFNDQLTLDIKALNQTQGTISITSANGIEMRSFIRFFNSADNSEINLNDVVKGLPSGIYFIKLTTSDQTISTKILKQDD